MSGVLGGGGVGGGLGGGGGGAQGGGLCVFSCSTFFSAIGAIAALYDYDLGAESAFFAVNGLGALCFAKCQYLRLAQQRSQQFNNKNYLVRNDWAGGNDLGTGATEGGGFLDFGVRRRRDGHNWEDEDDIPPPKASKNKTKDKGQSRPKAMMGVGEVS